MRRILYLDGLRGWAALFVLFHHLLLTFAPDGKETALHASPVVAPLGFLTDGPLAVAVFFILSGIVLTAAVTAAQEKGLQLSLPALLLKRWLRLGLPICAAGLLVLTLFVLNLDRSIAIGWASESSFMREFFPPGYAPTPALILREAFLSAFIGPTPPHDPVLWTIRIEFAGSILIFLLALLIPAGRLRLFAATGAGIALALLPPAWPETQPLGWIGNYCALFALGMVLHELLRLDAARAGKPGGWRDPSGLTLIIFGLCLYPLFGIRIYDLASTPPVIGGQPILGGSQLRAALVVTGVLLSPTLQQILANPVSAFLGRISFGLYLLHAPLIWSAGGLSYFALSPTTGHLSAALLASMLVLILALGLSALFESLIERPSIRISGRLVSWIAALPRRLRIGRGHGVSGNLELAPVAARRQARHAFE
ncbi:MAG: acyltransferase [Ferrovibrio sp.]|uniref:acyltransferase family protein n=1 Tax=Ferrovibrio sp. TaxID=1917215 RepID=UPI00261447AE|nr:acyltransferase [Ferrovibrio sp.]MCW0233734.1 acyltransferase [Ferrovibrio sp.]